MNYRKTRLILLGAVTVMCGCKIQNVAGPYQPAPSKITIEELAAAEEQRGDVAPMPDKIIRKTDQTNAPAQNEDLVDEPIQPTPVKVEPEPVIIEPEIIVEKEEDIVEVPKPVVVEKPKAEPVKPEVEKKPEVEHTRAESFVVLEGQNKVELKKYHVVIGSFGNKNNAYRLQSQMKPQYNPILVVNDKGMLRVLLVSYDTYKEARAKINEIKYQFPDAWVLIQKQEVAR